MQSLTSIVREEVAKYAGSSGRELGIFLFPILDDERHTYAVNTVGWQPRKNTGGGVVVLARVVEDKVIVEADATDRPLLDALIQRGVPRSQIVLAY